MPLVKRVFPKKQTKLSLDQGLINVLECYCVWSHTTASKVVEVALERLFEQDEDWKAHNAVRE